MFVKRQPEWYGCYQPLGAHLIGDQPDSFEGLEELRRAVNRFSAGPSLRSLSLSIQQSDGILTVVVTDLAELIKNSCFGLLARFQVAFYDGFKIGMSLILPHITAPFAWLPVL